jgi:predicted flap endonuclease-1-like 5' DNA nuclease
MPMFLIQSAILIAIAFLIGCIFGCLFRRWFGAEESAPVAAAAATAAVAAAPVFRAPEPASAPAPVRTPEPASVVMTEPVMALTPVAKPAASPKPVAKPRPVAAVRPVAAAKPVAASRPLAKPKPAIAAAPAKPDDLKLIVGIGPKNDALLRGLGITRFAQIAGWSPRDEASYGEKLQFPGRIEREEWVRQARKLAAGGRSEDKAELARKGSAATAKADAVNPAAPKARAVKTAAPKAEASKASLPKSVVPKAAVSSNPAIVKSAARPVAKTAASPAKKPIAIKLAKPVGGKPDNLTLINGIGNVIEKRLHGMGVFHFQQVANWTKEQAEDFSKAVGFPGRAEREGWMKEAELFAKGGTTEHARLVEAGQIPTSRKSSTLEKGSAARAPKKR